VHFGLTIGKTVIPALNDQNTCLNDTFGLNSVSKTFRGEPFRKPSEREPCMGMIPVVIDPLTPMDYCRDISKIMVVRKAVENKEIPRGDGDRSPPAPCYLSL